jgi:hypothetical protein
MCPMPALDSPSKPAATAARHTTTAALWAGRILTALAVVMMLASAAMKLAGKPAVVEAFVGHLGYAQRALLPIAAVEIACALLYAIPRTAVLGAVLLTAYLGGAVATHVRIGEAFVAPVAVGVLAWVGLYLREERLRALAPLRRPAA